MDSALRDELLYHVACARGEPTEELYGQIELLRKAGAWKFAEPKSLRDMQRMLLSLSAQGQVVNVAGLGWVLASAVPKAERRTFEEVTQGSFF